MPQPTNTLAPFLNAAARGNQQRLNLLGGALRQKSANLSALQRMQQQQGYLDTRFQQSQAAADRRANMTDERIRALKNPPQPIMGSPDWQTAQKYESDLALNRGLALMREREAQQRKSPRPMFSYVMSQFNADPQVTEFDKDINRKHTEIESLKAGFSKPDTYGYGDELKAVGPQEFARRMQGRIDYAAKEGIDLIGRKRKLLADYTNKAYASGTPQDEGDWLTNFLSEMSNNPDVKPEDASLYLQNAMENGSVSPDEYEETTKLLFPDQQDTTVAP
jgi:hypothetical protein